jgi:hypothetical protein
MNTLPLILRKNGFNYTQVLRAGNKAIYAQTVTENLEYYEVFYIRERPDRVLNGKLIKGGEAFPGNEDFGKTAWSLMTRKQAIKKYLSLNNGSII